MKAENGYPYSVNILLAVDQTLNALLGGACDETLSSRTFRMASLNKPLWILSEKFIDGLFFWDYVVLNNIKVKHCELSYEVEMLGGHMPKGMVKYNIIELLNNPRDLS
jgi:hypothetical protein